MVDEMGLGMTFTSVAVAIVCKLVTQIIVMGLPLSMLWRNTLEDWLMLAQNNFPGIVSENQEWYPLWGLNSVPHHMLQIQASPPHGHPALASALKQILVITVPGVAETMKHVIDEMTPGTGF